GKISKKKGLGIFVESRRNGVEMKKETKHAYLHVCDYTCIYVPTVHPTALKTRLIFRAHILKCVSIVHLTALKIRLIFRAHITKILTNITRHTITIHICICTI